jgi:hypothetical protein
LPTGHGTKNNRNEKIINNNNNDGIVSINNFLINNVQFLKDIKPINYSMEEIHFNLKESDIMVREISKLDKQTVGFDFSFGLQPILRNIIVLDTPITDEAFRELMCLFRVNNIIIYFILI